MASPAGDPAPADYIFMILMDVPEAIEDRFNTVYDTDHLVHMMQLPGNRRCDRYRLDWSDNEGMLRYLALYEIDDPDLPRSEGWARQARQGAWASEIGQKVSARRSGVFRRLASHPVPQREQIGRDVIYFLQQAIPAELEARFNHLYDTDHIPLMLQASGVSGCTRWRLEWSQTGDVPDYLTIYGIDSPDVPRSPAWKEQTGKGAWPVEMRPNFVDRRNGAFTRIAEHLGNAS